MDLLKNRIKLKFIISILLIVLTYSLTFSQVIKPVKWNFKSKKISDNEVELTFTARIDKGWHLYSQHIPEGGPVATLFSFDKNNSYKLIGTTLEPKPIKEYDPNFKMIVKYFTKKAVFKQRVKILNKKTFNIKGYLEFMCCDNSRCLPPNDLDFEFNLEKNHKPKTAANKTNEIARLQTDSLYKTGAVTKVSSKDTNNLSSINRNSTIGKQTQNNTGTSLWTFFLLAFLGGLAAIVMPCVFPMIPLTVSFFMHNADNKKKSKKQALFFSLSIIVIYTGIGLIVSATLGPDFVNWLSTNWIPNVLFFIIFMFFAASFFGAFELTLPSWLINKSDKQADKGGYLGSFFMAFTLVLVSFSCTVPIIGTILVEAARGELIRPVVGMLGFSLAFALPFGFFAFFPSKLKNLPKSGGWINTVKVSLGFLELALGLKFLMIPDQTYHWGILDREIYIALWIAIFILFGLYLLRKIKFANDSDVSFVSIPRLILSIITFAFVIYLIPGMFGAPLKAISGYLPPRTSQDFDINAIVRNESKVINSGCDKTNYSSICGTPKYSNLLELPNGLEGYFEFNQAFACAKKQNKPLFIDFTGHGCVNCLEMEQNVLSDPRVMKRLRNDFIILFLYVDDKIKLPKSEWSKSIYDGKIKKELGKKNADIQITYFNANSQPNYILLDNKGKLNINNIRNDILAKPRGHNLDVEAFVKFLDIGLKEFHKRHNI